MSYLKNISLLLASIFIAFFLIFLIIEKTNLFENIYNPGLQKTKTKELFFKEQGFEKSYIKKIISESSEIQHNFFEDYYYVSPSVSNNGEYINITNYYNSRKVNFINNIEDAEEIIWFFGGSTMLQLGTEDKLTTPSAIAKEFQNDKKNVYAVNFGMSGFNSTLERIKFFDLLLQVPIKEHPDSVIFYHGLNDMVYSYEYKSPNVMPYYMTKSLKIIVNQDNFRLLVFSLERIFWRSFAVLNYLKNNVINLFTFKNLNISRKSNYSKEEGISSKSNQNDIKLSTEYLINNQRIVNATCKKFKINCYFILQPSLVTKKNPSDLERKTLNALDEEFIDYHLSYYDILKNRQKDYFFLDLSDILDNSTYSDYTDWMHTFQNTNTRIGKKIYVEIFSKN